eukprot:TRINITY_DN3496_c0_g2_i1.p1 TRINITY_DN3496_c0_g2~~TRINITY_DN3496_c0_g2_i1.p1  ORF type:complete len:105 (-),score=22.06 TRINITY_DN3496_c0_g2_i1:953-1267(-)
MSMYVRVKRHNQTYFVHCEPSESTWDLKQKIEAYSGQPAADLRLVLLKSERVASDVILDDSKSLAEQKVENDFVLGLVFKLDSGEWEAVRIDKPSEDGTVEDGS